MIKVKEVSPFCLNVQNLHRR